MPFYTCITNLCNLDLQLQLPKQFDVEKLKQDFDNLSKNFVATKQHGTYHDGRWKAIGLVTAEGDINNDKFSPEGNYLPTEALEYCPYIKDILDQFPAKKNRVRIMFLEPGAEINWHCDVGDSIDLDGSSRFHIPIFTSEKVEFIISHQECHWEPGNLYYGDFSFPHRVKNNWDQTRVHLVIDMQPNTEIRGLFPDAFFEASNKRALLRALIHKYFYLLTLSKRALEKIGLKKIELNAER